MNRSINLKKLKYYKLNKLLVNICSFIKGIYNNYSMVVFEKLKNTLIWGFILWLVGYVSGIVLFFVVSKDYIGWIITPFATVFTTWVLVKKIKRSKFISYIGLASIWVIMAITLDYLFLVKLFGTGVGYYKTDVILYYLLTFALPVVIGYWKSKNVSSKGTF